LKKQQRIGPYLAALLKLDLPDTKHITEIENSFRTSSLSA